MQAFDTAQFIQMTSLGSDLVILAGDLNTEPGDLAYRIMLSVSGLVDAFMKAGERVNHISATSECLTNSYTSAHLVKKKTPGKRIDYIMYHPGSNLYIQLKNYCLPLPDKVPYKTFSYSDHEGVEATLIITKNQVVSCYEDIEFKKSVLEESIEVCDEALNSLNNSKWLYWFFTFILLAMLFFTLTVESPFGLTPVYHILKVLISLFLFYTLMMATIWNKIEKHAIISGRFSMITSLKKCQKVDT